MKLHSIIVLIVITLILSACETSVTDSPNTTEQKTTLEYNGGLNVTFNTGIEEFNKSVRIIHQQNNSYILDLQMNVKTFDEKQREQATLQIDIPFISENGILPAGSYILSNEEISSAYGSYELNKNNGDYARFKFKGQSATLVIDESNSESIKGGLILNLVQLSGKRMIDGQLEDIVLSSPVSLRSQFNLDY